METCQNKIRILIGKWHLSFTIHHTNTNSAYTRCVNSHIISPWSLKAGQFVLSIHGQRLYISLRGVKRMFVYTYLLIYFSRTIMFFTTKVHIYEDIYQFWL